MDKRRDATADTTAAQQAVLKEGGLDWADQQDFEDASRGFIARLETPTVIRADGAPVMGPDPYAFLDAEEAPATVNPSLWRQARLNMLHGLFKVADRVYQVRGIDLSVISFIEGDTGWIVIDPLISTEVAAASLELVQRARGAAAGRRRHLHAQPRRPLGRRQGRDQPRRRRRPAAVRSSRRRASSRRPSARTSTPATP